MFGGKRGGYANLGRSGGSKESTRVKRRETENREHAEIHGGKHRERERERERVSERERERGREFEVGSGGS